MNTQFPSTTPSHLQTVLAYMEAQAKAALAKAEADARKAAAK